MHPILARAIADERIADLRQAATASRRASAAASERPAIAASPAAQLVTSGGPDASGRAPWAAPGQAGAGPAARSGRRVPGHPTGVAAASARHAPGQPRTRPVNSLGQPAGRAAAEPPAPRLHARWTPAERYAAITGRRPVSGQRRPVSSADGTRPGRPEDPAMTGPRSGCTPG
jgi:hypothetical protein